MSKSSIVMLGLFVVLGVGWFLQDDGPKEAEHPAVSVDGFVSKDVSLQDVKILNKDDAAPYTRWEVTRKGETFVLEKAPGEEKKKHSESRWIATRTYAGGKKMTAKGETYRVRMYAQTLSRSFRSSYSFAIKDSELAEYGLDPDNRVVVKATGGGKTVELIIGKVDKPSAEDEANAKSWVMRPDVKNVVYQVAGFDLRTNFDVPWKDVRDRKILDIKIPRLTKVVLEHPKDPLATKVVVTRPPLPADQEAKLKQIEAEEDREKREKLEKELRKSNDGWKFETPANYAVGEVGSWLESVERMALTENADIVDGKMPAGSGLDDAKETVKITLFEGDKKTVVVAGKAMKEGEKDVWFKLGGDDRQAFRVASWSAEQVIKQLDDLRDTKLFGKAKMDVVKKADNLVIDSPEGRFMARLKDGKWTARGVLADHKKVKDFIEDLAGLDVDYESGKGRSDVGLDKPEWRIELSAAGNTFVVALASKRGEDFFGAVGTDGNVFKLQSWNADRVRKSATHLKDSHLFVGVTKDDIVGIELPDGEAKRAKLVRGTGGTWQLKPHNAAIPLKNTAVQALATALAEATWDSELKDKKDEELGFDDKSHRLGVTTKTGKFELVISANAKDGNPYIAVNSGRKRLVTGTMSSFGVGAIKKSLGDLK